jgi:hypothetical protein
MLSRIHAGAVGSGHWRGWKYTMSPFDGHVVGWWSWEVEGLFSPRLESELRGGGLDELNLEGDARSARNSSGACGHPLAHGGSDSGTDEEHIGHLHEFAIGPFGWIGLEAFLEFVEGRQSEDFHPFEGVGEDLGSERDVRGEQLGEGWIGFEDRDAGVGIAGDEGCLGVGSTGGEQLGELMVGRSETLELGWGGAEGRGREERG